MRLIQLKTAIFPIITVILDGAYFGLTNPSRVSSFGLMAGFVLAVVNIYWLARVLAALLGLYSKTLRRHNKRLARALTINGALLVGLQSVGQLSIRDLVVLIPLVAGSYLYLSLVRPGKIDT